MTPRSPLQRKDDARDALAGRLALSPDEAAAAIGCSRTYLDAHVMPDLRVVRRGRRRFIPVRVLELWLEENATRAIDGRGTR